VCITSFSSLFFLPLIAEATAQAAGRKRLFSLIRGALNAEHVACFERRELIEQRKQEAEDAEKQLAAKKVRVSLQDSAFVCGLEYRPVYLLSLSN
jgi:hypothetical protein